MNGLTALSVPTRRWGLVVTDFIVKLPRTARELDSISTWVDRLSRRVGFVAREETDQAHHFAQLFFANIFPHHGLPDAIICYRNPRFISKFWQFLMSLSDVKLCMASSGHPKTDGASEVMNRMVENYIHGLCTLEQDDWDTLLPSAEFVYNSAVSEDIGLSLFQVDLGWAPKVTVDALFQAAMPVGTLCDFRDRLSSFPSDAHYVHRPGKARQTVEAGIYFKLANNQV